jgi:hypothetical protein
MSLGQTDGCSSAIAALAPDSASIKAQPRMHIPRIIATARPNDRIGR